MAAGDPRGPMPVAPEGDLAALPACVAVPRHPPLKARKSSRRQAIEHVIVMAAFFSRHTQAAVSNRNRNRKKQPPLFSSSGLDLGSFWFQVTVRFGLPSVALASNTKRSTDLMPFTSVCFKFVAIWCLLKWLPYGCPYDFKAQNDCHDKFPIWKDLWWCRLFYHQTSLKVEMQALTSLRRIARNKFQTSFRSHKFIVLACCFTFVTVFTFRFYS